MDKWEGGKTQFDSPEGVCKRGRWVPRTPKEGPASQMDAKGTLKRRVIPELSVQLVFERWEMNMESFPFTKKIRNSLD